MRLNRSMTLLAQVALGAASIAAAADFSYSEEHNRILRSIGTEPDVEIEYDGSNAVCEDGGTGRRLHGEQTNDPRCSTDYEQRWLLQYKLEDNDITILSCSGDKVLVVTSTDPMNKPTEADCNFLWNTASDIAQQPEYKDKGSLHAQLVKGIQLLCPNRAAAAGGGNRRLAADEVGWPAGLPIAYVYDKDIEWDYQRKIAILFNGPDQGTHFEKPPEDFMYDPIYQSLCFAVDNKYVGDENLKMAAAPTTNDGPCPSGPGQEYDMRMGPDQATSTMTCQTPPQDADNTLNWALDKCFGRCGGGCHGELGLSQYTNDCVDYDFCTRFNIDREGPGNCTDEFLHTIDDTLWSGNCKDGAEIVPDPIEDCTQTPTTAPVPDPTTDSPTGAPVPDPATDSPTEAPAMDPTTDSPATDSPTDVPTTNPVTDVPTDAPLPPFNPPVSNPTTAPFPAWVYSPKPKVITFGVDQSCTQTCLDASGDYECTVESLSENNFNQNFFGFGGEVQQGLGVTCDNYDMTKGTDGAVAYATTPTGIGESQNITCFPSADDRDINDLGTFNCDAVPPAGNARFCACYEIP